MGIRDHIVSGVDRHKSYRRSDKTATSTVLSTIESFSYYDNNNINITTSDTSQSQQQGQAASASAQLGRAQVDQFDQGREAKRLISHNRRHSNKIFEQISRTGF